MKNSFSHHQLIMEAQSQDNVEDTKDFQKSIHIPETHTEVGLPQETLLEKLNLQKNTELHDQQLNFTSKISQTQVEENLEFPKSTQISTQRPMEVNLHQQENLGFPNELTLSQGTVQDKLDFQEKIKVRRELNLANKVRALHMYEQVKSCRKVAQSFGVGKTQIQGLLRHKADILREFESGSPLHRKRRPRSTINDQINQLTLQWYREGPPDSEKPFTGPQIQAKAHNYAQLLGIPSFNASNGWLRRFLQRNAIRLSDNRKGDAEKELLSMCSKYNPKDIFCFDETRLLVQNIGPTDAADVNNFSSHREAETGKQLTLGLCASMTGEKLPLVIVGSSPCFPAENTEWFPVQYHVNEETVMTCFIFEQWLQTFNFQMRIQERKVLLLLNTSASHSKMVLSNVILAFLPDVPDRLSQPVDHGLSQAVKLHFRHKQLTHIASQMELDSAKTATNVMQSISLLDAIFWISSSWQDVRLSTIQNCFRYAGFAGSCDTITETVPELEDVPVPVLQLSLDIFGVNFMDLPSIDHGMNLSDSGFFWNRVSQDIPQENNVESERTLTASPVDTNHMEEILPKTEVISVEEALCHLEALKQFALQRGNTRFLQNIMNCRDMAAAMQVSPS